MARISEEDINRIREKADIAEVIGKYLPLTKKGRNYRAVCPFHNDHDPSMNINTDRQIFKCFVCGEGGNVFSFVQKYEKISFPEAVVKVAELIGEPLDYVKEDLVVQKYDQKTLDYFKIFKEAISFTSYQLFSSGAKEVLDYLHKRGYSDELIKKFEIGYNPDNDGLYRFLKAKGYSEKDLLTMNLIRNGNDGFHDVFARRIIFPIYNADHQPIAFNGRAAWPNQEPKYVNSQETPIYTKGNILYHYDAVKQAVKDKGCVYVVEGVTDCYAFDRAGITNCVATLGTAMSKAQIQLLKNLRTTIVLSYDGDNAGQNANYKNAKLLHDAGLEVNVVRNDTKLDPDEIIGQKGVEFFREMITHQEVYMEFMMRFLSSKYDFSNYNQKKDYVMKVTQEINGLKDAFDRDTFTRLLSKVTGFDLRQLQSLSASEPAVINVERKVEPQIHKTRLTGKRRAELEILSEMLSSNQAASLFKEKMGYLPDEDAHKLAMEILDFYRKNGKMNVATLLDRIQEEEVVKLVLEIEENDSFAHVYNEEALNDAFRKIMEDGIDERILELRKKMALEANSAVKAKITEQILELRKKKLEL